MPGAGEESLIRQHNVCCESTTHIFYSGLTPIKNLDFSFLGTFQACPSVEICLLLAHNNKVHPSPSSGQHNKKHTHKRNPNLSKISPLLFDGKMTKVWLITGCSSGFGHEIALAALEHGDKVVATARDPSKLADLKAKGALTVKLDVTSSDEVLAGTVADVLKQVEHIDILVNNAGYILQGAVEECR